MSKVSIMGDIHQNAPSLKRALDICKSEGVNVIYVLGDSFGRNGDAQETYDLLYDGAILSPNGAKHITYQGHTFEVRTVPGDWEFILYHLTEDTVEKIEKGQPISTELDRSFSETSLPTLSWTWKQLAEFDNWRENFSGNLSRVDQHTIAGCNYQILFAHSSIMEDNYGYRLFHDHPDLKRFSNVSEEEFDAMYRATKACLTVENSPAILSTELAKGTYKEDFFVHLLEGPRRQLFAGMGEQGIQSGFLGHTHAHRTHVIQYGLEDWVMHTDMIVKSPNHDEFAERIEVEKHDGVEFRHYYGLFSPELVQVADTQATRYKIQSLTSVGAIGAPRERETRNQFGILNTETGVYTEIRAEYNKDAAKKTIDQMPIEQQHRTKLKSDLDGRHPDIRF